MVFDTYWPTYLATINVLCVPASPISRVRFYEIFDRLRSVSHVDVSAVGQLDDLNSDLIATSRFQHGAALFAYSADAESTQIQRHPLELNATAQVVIGVYDYGSAIISDSASSSQSYELALRRLKEGNPDKADNGRVHVLLVINAPSESSSDSMVFVPDLDHKTMLTAMASVYRSLFSSLSHLTRRLAEIDLVNPHYKTLDKDGSATASLTTSTHTPVDSEGGQQNYKGRYTFVIGLLNLYLGAWPDAMRRLSECAAIARDTEDFLWQARALEALLICMVLHAWKGIDFLLPDVCQKAYETSQMMSKSSIFGRPISIALPYQTGSDDTNLSPIQKWSKYAPVVVQAVLSTYTRLASAPASETPSTIFSESRIRSINLLILSQNEISTRADGSLAQFLLERKHPDSLVSLGTFASATSTGASIPNLLLEVLPTNEEAFLAADGFAATLAIAGSLSALKSNRRHAFVLKDLLQRLASTLVKARKIGASEAGVHPAAALLANGSGSADSSKLTGGIRPLLQIAVTAFGLPPVEICDGNEPIGVSRERVENNISSWCDQQIDGDILLKTEMLLQCIRVCDALPDIPASLHYTSVLLRLALRDITISGTISSTEPSISYDEQTRLIEGLKRTAGAARRSGLTAMQAPYWDEFLVRDIQILQHSTTSTLRPHKPQELSLVSDVSGSGSRDPFIFNPFARNTVALTTPVVVANEMAVFSVLLQNPLEVDIDINEISLVTEGAGFEPDKHSMVLGPRCSQPFVLRGKALQSGSLKIIGCKATIDGCCSQVFPILRTDWRPPMRTRQKFNHGKASASRERFTAAELKIPEFSTLSLTVIEPQPELEIISASLTQPAFMLLDGEKKCIDLKVRNKSATVASDLLLFTYTDNITKGHRETLGKKDLLPIDTYEVQYQLKHCPVVSITGGESPTDSETAPGQVASYPFEICGRPGLCNAAIQIDFAYLGKPRSEIEQAFYTRQLRFPIDITVNGSIEIPRCNFMPVNEDYVARSLSSAQATSEVGIANGAPGHSKLQGRDFGTAPDGTCMLSIDMRNVWPQPLIVEVKSILSDHNPADEEDQMSGEPYVATEMIQPGQVTRVILLVPRLFVKEPFAPVPSLDTHRQFVVSASKMSLEAEEASRENFWYREELLKHLAAKWTEAKTGRCGEIDLRRGIRLNARTIDVLKVDHVEITFSLTLKGSTDPTMIDRLGNGHYSLQTEQFATLRVRVRNRSTDKLALILRLQPSLRNQPHNIALDLSRRFGYTGTLQRVLHPPLEPGESREADLGIIVYAAGNYDLNATVEEVKGHDKSAQAHKTDGVGSKGQRRIWHARAPCLIDASDPPG